MTSVNQKEYLKKYLKIGKSHGTKKKRKKTENTLGKRLKIIDDDISISLSEEIKEDLAGANEDAPQIVSIIDERPVSLMDNLWKPIVEADTVVEAPKARQADHLSKQRSSSEDQSPRRQRNGDQSPKRRKISEADHSPKRRRDIVTKDQSPERKRGYDPRDMSPKGRKAEDYSHKKHSQKEKSRKESTHQKHKTSRWGDSSPDSTNANIGKADKTMSGKKSGLQNAKDLVKELNTLRERENELFAKMTEEVSGVNAATISRKKKTTTPEEDAEQQRKQRELEAKYSRWGKGLKQVEDRDVKIAEQLHEMSKPLARYADDEDLERYQKEQLLEGDPMLMYMRKKRKKQAVEAGIPDKPVYMGDFMPNRYGIRPGFRWDGVDRSNGYEQKLFQAKNSEKASLEEALMWNTEDM